MVFYFSIIVLMVSLSFERILLSNAHKMECRDKSTCSECIQTPGCSWCSRIKDKDALESMCDTLTNILEVCDKKNIENPISSHEKIIDYPVRGSQNGEPIQIRPQKMALKLRTGDQVTIDIQFRKAENYPIDLYYVMDFSDSMFKYKNKLSKLGNKLAEIMKNITTNFQLGFGSFVDKVTLPYASTLPSDLLKPCSHDYCGPPYTFRNHLSLNANTERFSMEVSKAKMSGNLDTPEDALDALMQAIVCQEKISWREKARHILVLSTDADFHIAGDGKLGGVFQPHDGLCHLDENGYYTHALIYDYPSVSQINQKAVENNMNIIFAVTDKVRVAYNGLMNEIHGASLGFLDRGQDIADLVRAQYEKISTRIELTDNARGPVYITYSALCPGEKEWKNNTNECSKIKGGMIAHFQAHIKVTKCSDGDLTNQEIRIKPFGINETLTIKLETICDCKCGTLNHPGNEINSTYCSKSGNLICGQCSCAKNKIGKRCECNVRSGLSQDVNDITSCIAPNSTSNLICSGQGECKCGMCQCRLLKHKHEEISGRYCECDNFSCEKRNGLICSGHGKCKCKKCECDPGWDGEACDCPLDVHLCQSEPDAKECSGKGSCFCGVCHCHNQNEGDEDRYTGKYCQICMTCKEQCNLYNDCVECFLHNKESHEIYETCANCTDKFLYNFVDNINDANESNPATLCVSEDHSKCTFKYKYYYNENEDLIVLIEKEVRCPKKPDMLAVILGTTGSTVLIGLLVILIWKIVTSIYDKREYEKFERERKLAKWGRGDNPLYRTALTTYKNPTYQHDC